MLPSDICTRNVNVIILSLAQTDAIVGTASSLRVRKKQIHYCLILRGKKKKNEKNMTSMSFSAVISAGGNTDRL